MVIRYAVTGDYNKVCEIAKQGQDYHAKLRPDIYNPADDEHKVVGESFFTKMAKNKNAVIMTLENVISGYMIFYPKVIEVPFLKQRKVLFIDSLAVKEDSRQKKVARELMKWIKKYAKKNGYDAIELQVNAANEIAKHLYDTEGFTVQSYNMEMKLD